MAGDFPPTIHRYTRYMLYIPALKTHLLVAPEKGWLAWLEDYIPFEAWLMFRGYVSFREGML